eukprot:11172888-Lingulodinium_polyedra.AAC.1
MVGDLPDWYWTLELPPELSAYFCLEAVAPRDLEHLLGKEFGIDVSFGKEVAGFGFRCPVMGWSWAVVLAQWTLEDLLHHHVASFTASRR